MHLPFRLLAVDIDGTLLNSKFQVSERDKEALRYIHSLGIEVILCTGRRHTFSRPIAQQIGFDMWICSSNGAVTRSTQGEDFHRTLMPAHVAEQVCTHMKEFRGGTVVTFDLESYGALVCEHTNELHQHAAYWVEKNEPYIERIVPIESALRRGLDPVQAMVCGTVERIQQAEARLTDAPVRRHIHVMKTEYVTRDLSMLDILAAGCSKGHAVERWAKKRQIPAAEVLAIGDNYNDLEMLEFAGLKAVMANSSAGLLERGWHITRSHNESGVAAAIEHYLGAKVPETALERQEAAE